MRYFYVNFLAAWNILLTAGLLWILYTVGIIDIGQDSIMRRYENSIELIDRHGEQIEAISEYLLVVDEKFEGLGDILKEIIDFID
jgi:hypothetical protein